MAKIADSPIADSNLYLALVQMRNTQSGGDIIGHDGTCSFVTRTVHDECLRLKFIRIENIGAGVEVVKLTPKGSGFVRSFTRAKKDEALTARVLRSR